MSTRLHGSLTEMTPRRWLRMALPLLAIGGSLALAACNTTAGAGKDMSSAGHAITNSAEENK